MSAQILSRVSDELDELSKQLHTFKSCVEYISQAKEGLETAIGSVERAQDYHLQKLEKIEKAYKNYDKLVDDAQKLSNNINAVDFPKRLKSIDENLTEVVKGIELSAKSTLTELKKAAEVITKANFEGRFNNLNTLLNDGVSKTQSVATLIQTQNDIQAKNIADSIGILRKGVEKVSEEQKEYLKSLNLPFKFEKLDATVAGIMTGIQSVQSRLETLERNFTDRLKDTSDKQNEMIQALKSSNERYAKKQLALNYVTWVLVLATILITLFKV